MKTIFIFSVILLTAGCALFSAKEKPCPTNRPHYEKLPDSFYSKQYCVYRFIVFRALGPDFIITVSIKKPDSDLDRYMGEIKGEYYNEPMTKIETSSVRLTHSEIDELFDFLWRAELFSLPEKKEGNVSGALSTVADGSIWAFERYYNGGYIRITRNPSWGGAAQSCGEYFLKLVKKHKVIPGNYMKRFYPKPKPDLIEIKGENADI